MWSMKSPKCCCFLFSNHPSLNQDKYKICYSITANQPPNYILKQVHPRITHKPPVTLRNCSYAATQGFETSLRIIFVIKRNSHCKLESLLFVVNSTMNRSLLKNPYFRKHCQQSKNLLKAINRVTKKNNGDNIYFTGCF